MRGASTLRNRGRSQALPLLGLLLLSAAAQQLPVHDDPLYDLLARTAPTPAHLARAPRSLDEFRERADLVSAQPWREFLRWRLGQAERLPPRQGMLLTTLEGFGYPTDSNWSTDAKGAYRVVGLWSLGEQALLEMVWSDSARREGANPSAFDAMPLARLTFRTGEWEWQLARANLRWAGGYSGALLVNDAMPPVPYAHIAFPMHLPMLGKWQFEQFYAQFEQDGQMVWWGGRRLTRALDSRWSLSAAEAFKALRLPNGALSQLVPYYLYQKWMSRAEIGSGWFNYLAEIGVIYQPNATNRLYLFWLIDDIRAPDFLGGRGANTPRKIATLLGVRFKPTPDTRLILEGVLTDGTENGGTYGAAGHDPRYAYFYKGLPMGHPFGANRRGLYARFEWERERWFLALEGWNIGRFHDFLPGERGYQFDVQLSYQATRTSLLSLRYRSRHLRETDLPDARCGWWLQWSQIF
ncbi:hypothetical protein HRbin15_01735 [bacterium HR15]|nr:hypothetical protein HRbin15_01735 [bacterium HR15]